MLHSSVPRQICMMLFRAISATSKALARRAAAKERRAQADVGPEQGPAAWLAAPSIAESADIPLIAGITYGIKS